MRAPLPVYFTYKVVGIFLVLLFRLVWFFCCLHFKLTGSSTISMWRRCVQCTVLLNSSRHSKYSIPDVKECCMYCMHLFSIRQYHQPKMPFISIYKRPKSTLTVVDGFCFFYFVIYFCFRLFIFCSTIYFQWWTTHLLRRCTARIRYKPISLNFMRLLFIKKIYFCGFTDKELVNFNVSPDNQYESTVGRLHLAQWWRSSK